MNRFITRSDKLDELARKIDQILKERIERRGITRNQAWNELMNELESRIIIQEESKRKRCQQDIERGAPRPTAYR